MTLQFQHLRGVTEKVSVYTGLPGELVVDLSSKQIFVQDGVTAGGIGVAKDQLVTGSSRGLMSPLDKLKLDGIAAGANKYELPTAGASLGGVKTTSSVNSAVGLTACPIIAGVPYYKDTTYSTATTAVDGLMSATDKANLDNLVSQMATLVTQVEAISDKLNSLLAQMDTYYSGYNGYPRS